MKDRFPDPSEIRALDLKGEFLRFAICPVSATIGIDRSIFKICGESGVIGLAGKTPSAHTHLLLRSEAPRAKEISNRKNAITAISRPINECATPIRGRDRLAREESKARGDDLDSKG
jgi:hypothetical protein